MGISSPVIDKAGELAASGHHAEVVEYLGGRDLSELERSPSVALLYGTSQARLGKYDEGMRWLDLALEGARKKDEHAVERRALNARGAIALVSGRIDEAADFFTQALMFASRDGDLATTGRCSNNLGIISNLRGRHAEAIGSWKIAVAAFDRAGLRQGVAECRHNLGISYKEQGALDRALAEADRAVAESYAAGDSTLWAMAVRGRAEIRVARGDLKVAGQELEEVRQVRHRVPDPVGEAEDLRIGALLLAAHGNLEEAEAALREVADRAASYRRPHVQAQALRDLATTLRRSGKKAEAQEAARLAKAIFTELGAEGDIRSLAGNEWDDDFAAELRHSLEPLHEAQQLADAGRYAELHAYLTARSQDELEQSPMLALLLGIAHARLGRFAVGQQWAMVALSRARVLGDRRLEVRALNVSGAIALDRGGINEATHFFTKAQEEAMEDNDMAAVGRCANNLGIIANMQGDYGRAIGAYTRAIAAYEKAGFDRGIAESRHNLGISYREQGHLDDALRTADAAVKEAEGVGDPRLKAQALAGRAEIRTARGDPELAIREVERALAVHREMKDEVRETEDLRILAVALSVAGRTDEAQQMLHDVIHRASQHDRPLLVANALRDLAHALAREGRVEEAKKRAHAARVTFERLGAKVEVDRLDALLHDPDFLND